MTTMRATLTAMIVWLLAATPAAAQSLDLTSGGEDGGPIEITAEDGIEWQQGNSIFLARGNAKAIRGDVTVNADVLKAYYQDGNGPSEIWRLDAEGSVVIESPSERIIGDLAIYDVPNGVLVVRGEDIRFIAGPDTITADKQLEYWETKQMAVARGNAVAVRGDKRLNARVLAAYFKRQANGENDIDHIEAFDDVKITTKTETLTATRGIYKVPTGIATLTGDVRVERDGNVVTGCRAEVNLNTSISKMFSCNDGSGTRVQGTFMPSTKPEPPTGEDDGAQ